MSPKPTCSLDAVRAANPELGFALYAYAPGGAVTLEAHTPDGDVFTWKAPTAAEAMAMAFPEDAPPATPEPEPDIFG